MLGQLAGFRYIAAKVSSTEGGHSLNSPEPDFLVCAPPRSVALIARRPISRPVSTHLQRWRKCSSDRMAVAPQRISQLLSHRSRLVIGRNFAHCFALTLNP